VSPHWLPLQLLLLALRVVVVAAVAAGVWESRVSQEAVVVVWRAAGEAEGVVADPPPLRLNRQLRPLKSRSSLARLPVADLSPCRSNIPRPQ
jgi:hypothetical protein